MAAVWFGMFVTSAMPIIQIVIMCSMGALLARQGILHGQARQHLGQLVFFIFVPCLTFTKLASSVDLNNLAIWWPLPVNTAFSIIAGLLIGWATSMLIKPPPELKMHVIVATGLGNVGNLPLVIVATLCNERSSIFSQQLGPQCGQIGIAYVAFSMWVAGFVQYSLAYNLMKLPEKSGATPRSAKPLVKAATSIETPQLASGEDAQVLLTADSHAEDGAEEQQSREEHTLTQSGMDRVPDSKLQKSQRIREDEEDEEDQRQLELQPLWQHQLPRDSQAELGDQLGDHVVNVGDLPGSEERKRRSAETSSTLRQSPWEVNQSTGGKHKRRLRRWRRQGWAWLGTAWQRFVMVVNLPTAAALAGLAVGCARPIKGLLFGADPPLGFLTESLNVMADAMIPSMMLVLGSVLCKGPGTGKVPLNVILGILFMRQIAIPFLGTTAVVLLHWWGVFRAPDVLFFLVLLLTHTTPTAINLQTVVTIHQNKEAEMSCILFWQYICSIFTLPCFMTLYLAIMEHMTI